MSPLSTYKRLVSSTLKYVRQQGLSSLDHKKPAKVLVTKLKTLTPSPKKWEPSPATPKLTIPSAPPKVEASSLPPPEYKKSSALNVPKEQRSSFSEEEFLLSASLKKDFALLFPQLVVLDAPQSDRRAKQVRFQWKTRHLVREIMVLSTTQDRKEETLLINLAKALNQLMPAAFVNPLNIEKNSTWDDLLSTSHLKWIIMDKPTLETCKGALIQYKEYTQTAAKFLKKTPLFLLPEVSLYLQQPTLKRSLWQELCRRLEQIKTSLISPST